MSDRSKCCNALMRVETADEGTSCYMCEKCGNPCDWISERPRFKDDIGNVSYRSGWNACIDAYEQWEKDNPRLKKLDREKVAAELFIIKKGDHAPESEQIMIMEECYREASFICAKFGQPKDAVSVEEIENTIRKCSEHNHINATWAAKEVHDLINRKLKGQDNEAK